MHAEKCPVCGGTGRVNLEPDPGTTAQMGNEVLCHGCGGSGWVTVADSFGELAEQVGNWDDEETNQGGDK